MDEDPTLKHRAADDPRRAHGPGETPAATAALFFDALEKLSRGDGYDDDHLRAAIDPERI